MGTLSRLAPALPPAWPRGLSAHEPGVMGSWGHGSWGHGSWVMGHGYEHPKICGAGDPFVVLAWSRCPVVPWPVVRGPVVHLPVWPPSDCLVPFFTTLILSYSHGHTHTRHTNIHSHSNTHASRTHALKAFTHSLYLAPQRRCSVSTIRYQGIIN